MEDQHTGRLWLEHLLKFMGTPAGVKVERQLNQEDWLVIDEADLTPEQTTALIGEKGETIDAIQYLASTILNLSKDSQSQQTYTIELGEYRIRRQEELMTLAQEVAQQVRETGQETELRSLSSAERRQIHTYLKEAEGIKTESRGQEPDRRLVVMLSEE
ncbi:MAG: protein jag [Cyanophyceae cyanobacterium]